MALHASAAWVAAAAFCCGAGSAVFGTFYGTTLQQQVPPELLARVSALSIFPAYGLLSSATMLTLRSVRQVTWADSQPDDP